MCTVCHREEETIDIHCGVLFVFNIFKQISNITLKKNISVHITFTKKKTLFYSSMVKANMSLISCFMVKIIYLHSKVYWEKV